MLLLCPSLCLLSFKQKGSNDNNPAAALSSSGWRLSACLPLLNPLGYWEWVSYCRLRFPAVVQLKTADLLCFPLPLLCILYSVDTGVSCLVWMFHTLFISDSQAFHFRHQVALLLLSAFLCCRNGWRWMEWEAEFLEWKRVGFSDTATVATYSSTVRCCALCIGIVFI